MYYAPSVKRHIKHLIAAIIGLAMVMTMAFAVNHKASAATQACGPGEDSFSISVGLPLRSASAGNLEQAKRVALGQDVAQPGPTDANWSSSVLWAPGNNLSTKIGIKDICLERAGVSAVAALRDMPAGQGAVSDLQNGTKAATVSKKWAMLIGMACGVVARIITVAAMLASATFAPFAFGTGTAVGLFVGTLISEGLQTGNWKSATADAFYNALLAAIGGLAVRAIWIEQSAVMQVLETRIQNALTGWLFTLLRNWFRAAGNAVNQVAGGMAGHALP